MTGNVAKSDFKTEYEHTLQEIKELAKEYDESVPESLRERLKKKIMYAYTQLEMDPDIPKHKRVPKLMDDFAITLNVVIPKTTLYRWLGVKEDNGDDEKSSHLEQNNSSNASIDPECEQENERFTILAEKMKNLWSGIALKSRSIHILSKIPEGEREELLYLLEKNLENVTAEWDGRQDVSERQFFMLIAATTAGNDKATELYIRYVKDWHPLTGKQYTKLTHGKATMLPPIYAPKSKKEAVELGFYGMPCKCGSWRVAPTPEPTARMVLHCFACKSDFDAVSEKLPINQGIVIDSSKVV